MWLSPNEVCIGVAVSVKNICARFITVSVKKLLGPTLSGRRFITVSGGFITLSGSYYSIGRFYYIIGQLLQYIGRLLHYRLVQAPWCEEGSPSA